MSCDCGYEHQPGKCVGHSKRTGKPCTNPPITGATVCRMHGGAARQVKAAAERRQQDAAAHAAVVSYGLPVEIDPHTALLNELWRTYGHVSWLGAIVADLERDAMYGPVGGSEHGEPRYEPHVWIRLYQEERKHLASVARDCIKAGIEERRVQLAEQQGALLAQVIRGILTDLGVDQRPEVASVVRKHLSLATVA